MPSNRLASESSLYLLQHANNPVDWYPWCESALKKAKQKNKPILLSIGYSACHWCHVMAEESFEDPETAKLMNELFINIKVDREQRPDLDKIYQTAHLLLNGHGGGWPLTVFLTPTELTPFFVGTYFPKETQHGLPSFKDLLIKISDYFAHHQDDIVKLSRKIIFALEQITMVKAQESKVLNHELLKQARIACAKEFDSVHGGFGHAPKFPSAIRCLWLLTYWHEIRAFTMAVQTLTKMARSGLYDHVGGGFFRYCVDEAWHIPHFEKMLYDNALLLEVYSQAYKITHDKFYKQIISQTADWIIAVMQSPEGGYFASLNADSQGEEGKYYVWDRDEIKNAFNDEQWRIVNTDFGLDKAANFEGKWHLYLDEQANPSTAHAVILAQLKKLRDQRASPDCDAKILIAWNALMIKGLLSAANACGNSHYKISAQKALEFLYQQTKKHKRLLASAFLDDVAFLLDAVMSQLQIEFSSHYLNFAITLADKLYNDFYDVKDGGFYFTSHDQEKLIARLKPLLDESIPTGNGVAAYTLQRMGWLLGENRYLEAAKHTLQYASSALHTMPHWHHSLLFALEDYFTPVTIIVLRSPNDDYSDWQKHFLRHFLPKHLCFAIPAKMSNLPNTLNKPIPEKGVAAYICQGPKCLRTIDNIDEFDTYIYNFQKNTSE